MAKILSFSNIATYFKENISLLHRRENSYESGNVINVTFDGTVKPMLLKGMVSASMKKKTYNVEIRLDPEEGIVEASCSCPRGMVICHHMASLCLHGHHNISQTDQECQWRTRKSTSVDVQTIDNIHPTKSFRATVGSVTEAHRQEFITNLGNNIVGFSWLLGPEPTGEANLIIPIEEIVFSGDFGNTRKKKNEHVLNKCSIDITIIKKIEEATVGQTKNPNWFVVRKNRLTASKFGMVLGACTRNRFPPSLYTSLVEGYDVSSALAVKWGRENERHAIEIFESSMEKTVTASGIWLDECGFLGASPDGIVDEEDAIIEVKCPFKYRNKILFEELKKDKNYIIYKNENDETLVNEKHNYWHQIQGQMHIAKKNLCYLVVWTPTHCEIVMIKKDDEWYQNIEILKDFYLNKFIPYISGCT